MVSILPARDYFKIVEKAIEKNKGHNSLEDFLANRDLFYAKELYSERHYSTVIEKILIIYTKDFVLELTMEIQISSSNDDFGSWEKEYYVVIRNEEEEEYKQLKPISNNTVNEWFSKNIIEFI
jgi:hypothetical protein